MEKTWTHEKSLPGGVQSNMTDLIQGGRKRHKGGEGIVFSGSKCKGPTKREFTRLFLAGKKCCRLGKKGSKGNLLIGGGDRAGGERPAPTKFLWY